MVEWKRGWVSFTYHEEVGIHVRILPLFIEGKGATRETGDKHDGRFGWVARRLRPDLGSIGRCDVDGHSERNERDEGEERGELHGWLSAAEGRGKRN